MAMRLLVQQLFWVRATIKVIMNKQNCRILNWNVRGLNTKARRQVVKDLVTEHNCNIVCLQETKMQNLDATIVSEALGPKFANNFTYLPA